MAENQDASKGVYQSANLIKIEVFPTRPKQVVDVLQILFIGFELSKLARILSAIKLNYVVEIQGPLGYIKNHLVPDIPRENYLFYFLIKAFSKNSNCYQETDTGYVHKIHNLYEGLYWSHHQLESNISANGVFFPNRLNSQEIMTEPVNWKHYDE